MIQDIQPLKYKNEFTPREVRNDDLAFVFDNGKPLMCGEEDNLSVPTVNMLKIDFDLSNEDFTYLFSIDQTAAFLIKNKEKVLEKQLNNKKYNFYVSNIFRTLSPKWQAFAGVTAHHLSRWYESNRFCGCCGNKMSPSKIERAMICDSCGFTDYPKICPAIIVAVTNGNKIILTKYANRNFTRYALVAGFCEIGETVEETVKRETLEEVGVKVKNIRYYKSQPWGFSESLLMGFFAELDGDDRITLDTNELKVAEWVNREDIPEDTENELSLTYTMMQAFRNGEI